MIMSNYYAQQQQQQQQHYGYQPQGPPSPPMDDNSKCSLPSISNLLGLADGGSPTSETPPAQQSSSQKSDTRPSSSDYNQPKQQQQQQRNGGLPPTPPMSSDASFDGYSHHSPTAKEVQQMPTHNYYFDSAPSMGHVEPGVHRQHMVPRLPVQSGYAPAYTHSYMSPAMGSYYPAMQPTPPPQPQVSGLYFQRPLPQAFPPMPLGVMPSSGPSPWQHHHYISPSSAASFPQSQDRYICQTCNKAFSRPSSLRIHSHSHTGEKPFKCPHAGCGKAFSVRSNMKRHERGCHSFESSSSGSPLMQ
ncbi:unnamed protein product [Discula destructiva]